MRGLALSSPPHVKPTAERVWVRHIPQALIAPTVGWEENAVFEPDVIYDGGWKMWYTGGWTNAAMGYATCPAASDPMLTSSWTKNAGNPILGQGGSSIAGFAARVTVLRLSASSYRCFYADANPDANLKVSDSTDGIAWGTPTTAIASNAYGGVTGWANSSVWTEDAGSSWKMLIEGRTGSTWTMFYATSSDGHAFTVQGTALTSLDVPGKDNYGGPSLARGGALIASNYRLWYHAGSTLFSDIYYAYSTDAAGTWTIASGFRLIANLTTYEKEQAADPCVVERDGKTYLFYDGTDNTTPAAYINVAKCDLTLDEIVA